MADIESLLSRWQSAGILDAATVQRIRTYETSQTKPAGIAWQGVLALILGGILLAAGVVLFVSAHWDQLGPGARFSLVMAMVAIFHVGGGLARESFRGLSTALHAVGTVATGGAIALVGQIFNIQEHWPAAILLWAIAALAGWALLHDQAQQIIALLLIPAWMLSEIEFYTERHIGQPVYSGRFLLAWAALYLTFFIGSKRKVTQGVLTAVAAIASVVGVVVLLDGWSSWGNESGFIPFGVRVWCWIAIAAVPLLIAAFKGHRGLIPPAAAIAFAIALPWCQHVWVESYSFYVDGREVHSSYSRAEPNLAAHALVTAFTVFLIWYGVRQASRTLVNLGVLGFAIAVGWFYFSNIYDKAGRSLGLIGLGVLFLAGGWALERMRRRLIAGMGKDSRKTTEVAL